MDKKKRQISRFKHGSIEIDILKNYLAQLIMFFNTTLFAKTMYSDFSNEIKNKLEKFLIYKKHEKVKEKKETKKVLEIGCG